MYRRSWLGVFTAVAVARAVEVCADVPAVAQGATCVDRACAGRFREIPEERQG